MTASSRRIGIIKPCCLGDAVMALPVIDNLLAADPETETDVFCGAHTRPVFEAHGAIASIVDVPSIPTWPDLPALIHKLRASSASGFFILDRSRLIHLAARISGSRILGTTRRTDRRIMHETDRYLDTLRQSGTPVSIREPSLDLHPFATPAVQHLANEARSPFVILHPGGAENPGAMMHSKRWPAERWISLIDWLEGQGISSILTGSPAERQLCEQVAAGSGAIIAAGSLSILESAALASRSTAFIGPDTGLSHLAAATGTPTIAIFGPTNPRQYAPRGARVTVLAPDASYRIADTDLRKGGTGPGPSTDSIDVESVIGALSELLDAKRVCR
ncbi:MAG: glycosyltransferase family 9 protein [Thermomicrobiales bacterium]